MPRQFTVLIKGEIKNIKNRCSTLTLKRVVQYACVAYVHAHACARVCAIERACIIACRQAHVRATLVWLVRIALAGTAACFLWDFWFLEADAPQFALTVHGAHSLFYVIRHHDVRPTV